MSSPRLPLSSRQSFLPDEISRREFATVFRGYDPAEVRTFLNQLSEQAAENSDRIAEIQRTLLATEERVKNPELDEDTVTRLLGEQTAQILRSAREAANDIRAKAEEEVSRQLREAHEVTSRMKQEAEALLADRTDEAERMAETVRTDAANDAERMRREATEEAAALRTEVAEETAALRTEVAEETARQRSATEAELLRMRQQTQSDLVDERSRARQQARDLIDTARSEAQALVERTQAKQTELIENLVRKRKIALAQVEELRAGRQRLLKAYKMVRGTLDEVTTELERVEDEARQAAELAGTRSAQSNGLPAEELDTVVELEEFRLDDDVPQHVIDLVSEAEQASGGAAAYGQQGGIYDAANDAEDADDSEEETIVLADGSADDGSEDDFSAGQRSTDGIEGGPASPASTSSPMTGGSSIDARSGVAVAPVATQQASAVQPQQAASAAQALWPVDADDEADIADHEQLEVVEERRGSGSSSLIIGESFAATGSGEMDRALQLRRDAVVGKARSQAVRRLKRALQDEQDALSARLRTESVQSADELLGSAEDQASSYHRAVVKLFREVVRTGASSVEGSTGVERGVIDRTGTSAARGMAAELVEDLRSQLQPVVEKLLAEDEMPEAGEIQHRMAEPYRAIRGDYLDQLVDDRIGGVFDQGVAFARG